MTTTTDKLAEALGAGDRLTTIVRNLKSYCQLAIPTNWFKDIDEALERWNVAKEALAAHRASEKVEPVALEVPEDCAHLIVYDDAEMKPALFAGAGARDAALKTFERLSGQWNAHLFVKIKSNSRDDRHAGVNAYPVQAASNEKASNWCLYVAGMVGAYLKLGVDDPKIPVMASVIERRLWALGQPPASPEPDFSNRHLMVQYTAEKYGPLIRAAINLLGACDSNHDTKQPPQKFGVPYGEVNALRAALEGHEPASSEKKPLSPEDMNWLERIQDQFSDGEGYDAPKAVMQRLADLGAVRRTSGSRYSLTSFGMHCLFPDEWPLPLRTHGEYMDEADARQEAKVKGITAQATADKEPS